VRRAPAHMLRRYHTGMWRKSDAQTAYCRLLPLRRHLPAMRQTHEVQECKEYITPRDDGEAGCSILMPRHRSDVHPMAAMPSLPAKPPYLTATAAPPAIPSCPMFERRLPGAPAHLHPPPHRPMIERFRLPDTHRMLSPYAADWRYFSAHTIGIMGGSLVTRKARSLPMPQASPAAARRLRVLLSLMPESGAPAGCRDMTERAASTTGRPVCTAHRGDVVVPPVLTAPPSMPCCSMLLPQHAVKRNSDV